MNTLVGFLYNLFSTINLCCIFHIYRIASDEANHHLETKATASNTRMGDIAA